MMMLLALLSAPALSSGCDPTNVKCLEVEAVVDEVRGHRYLTASKGLHDLLVAGNHDMHRTKLQYYLAKSLYELRLYHSAQHLYSQVVRRGPKSPYFEHAMPWLVVAIAKTGDGFTSRPVDRNVRDRGRRCEPAWYAIASWRDS